MRTSTIDSIIILSEGYYYQYPFQEVLSLLFTVIFKIIECEQSSHSENLVI